MFELSGPSRSKRYVGWHRGEALKEVQSVRTQTAPSPAVRLPSQHTSCLGKCSDMQRNTEGNLSRCERGETGYVELIECNGQGVQGVSNRLYCSLASPLVNPQSGGPSAQCKHRQHVARHVLSQWVPSTRSHTDLPYRI
jgi:hypothetical protein